MAAPTTTPLTGSGKGCAIEGADVLGRPDTGAVLQGLLASHAFAVVRGAARDVEGAKDVLRQLGDLVEHEKRVDGELALDGSKDEEEVLRGQECMPLHKDGLLMGIEVRTVGIFCVRFREVRDGRTFVCDAKGAMDELPADVMDALGRHGIEAEAVDTDYYLREGGRWHPLPALSRLDDGPGLNLGLPYPPGARPSWRVRIAGVGSEESDRLLAGLERTLMSDRFLYYHDWREGDLILMDNQRVLHGREAFEGDRVLSNLQVA